MLFRSENILAVPFVEQMAVLPRCKVFVTHGGMNSTMEAVMSRIPMLVIPQMVEQAATAFRVDELGLGRKLLRNDVSVETIRRGIDEVLNLKNYPAISTDFAAACRDAGGVDRAVQVVESAD